MAVVALASVAPASAQTDSTAAASVVLDVADEDADGPFVLTLDQAIRVALQQNFDMRRSMLDIETAEAQVKEAWGSVYPQVDVSAGYTRNVVAANPFAGSDISSIFGGGPTSDWVAYNERRRLDDDPSTDPISFEDFAQQQQDSLAAAGVPMGSSSNPFGVDNEFSAGIRLTQTLYDGSAFSAISGAERFKKVEALARDRQVQVVANDVYDAFYSALLAQQQAVVAEQRVERSQETVREIRAQVSQGVIPKYQRLSAEVELSNARTAYIEAQNSAEGALDQFKQTLGIAVDAPVRLEGTLDADGQDAFMRVGTTDAIQRAFNQRADVQRAQIAIELEEVRRKTTRAELYPTVSAFVDFNYTGRVPDDRTQYITTNQLDPIDPFFVAEQQNGFFSDSYWNPALSVGVQLSWTIFNGYQSRSRIQQDAISIRRAEVQLDELKRAVELEVKQSLRNLRAARERIQTQQQNVQVAETNYEYTLERVQEGVSNQLELREASDQLDESRLNFLNAVYDYLDARSDVETAIGEPLTPATSSFQMTSR